MVSCSGEIYEDELRVGEDKLAYVGETDKLYSGDVLDKYGEKMGTYKKGIKDGAWTEICLLYTSPSPRDKRQSRMPSSA